jgi:hypothetical protein
VLEAADVILDANIVSQRVDETRLPVARIVFGIVNGGYVLQFGRADSANPLGFEHVCVGRDSVLSSAIQRIIVRAGCESSIGARGYAAGVPSSLRAARLDQSHPTVLLEKAVLLLKSADQFADQ